MKRRALACCVLALVLAAPSQSAAYSFGKQEDIHHIQDVKMKGPKGEALFLGHKTASESFVLPMYMTDEGYVLGLKENKRKYYDLPKGERLRTLQAAGDLPDPLPPYSISWVQWIFGHSFWLGLAMFPLFIGWEIIAARRKKARSGKAA